MVYHTKFFALAALGFAAGCSNGGSSSDAEPVVPTETVSMQLAPSSQTNFNALVNAEIVDYENTDTDLRFLSLSSQNGSAVYALVGQGETTDGLVYFGYAGLNQANTLTGVVVDTGTINYDSTYRILEYTGVSVNPTENNEVTGNITLVANFTDNAITADDGLFTLEGTLSDSEQGFDGTVTWRGVEGEIEGLISSTKVLGAFQGSDDDTVFAGYVSGDPE